MTGFQLRPGGLNIDPDAPDGFYLIQKTGNRFSAFVRLVDSDTATIVQDPDTGDVSINTSGLPPGVEYILTVTDGVPSYVFDTDGQLVTTEVPA